MYSLLLYCVHGLSYVLVQILFKIHTLLTIIRFLCLNHVMNTCSHPLVINGQPYCVSQAICLARGALPLMFKHQTYLN